MTHPLKVSDIYGKGEFVERKSIYDTDGIDVIKTENEKHGIILYGFERFVNGSSFGIGEWYEIIEDGKKIKTYDAYHTSLRFKTCPYYHLKDRGLLVDYYRKRIYILNYHRQLFSHEIQRRNELTVVHEKDMILYFNDDGKIIYQKQKQT